MEYGYSEPMGLVERGTLLLQRAVRLAALAAAAFGVSVLGAILLGAAVTDDGFTQIFVTILAAAGLWLPIFAAMLGLARLFGRRGSRPVAAGRQQRPTRPLEPSWRRLHAIAPAQRDRLAALRSSLESSHVRLSQEQLDPDAHDLCLLIDRRLPELIDRELDALPPDDVHRGRQVEDLINLIEQFARHCSRSGEQGRDAGRDAAVLRRRFEARLSGGELLGGPTGRA